MPLRVIRSGFTLVELLVVIAIIAVLAALLVPALASAKAAGRKASCISNLRQIGIAIHNYVSDSDGNIPFGPKAPPYTNPSNFYPSTGTPTSLISLNTGEPVALGLLLRSHLAEQPNVLFCPGVDQKMDAASELAKVGKSQAQGSYFYRHNGRTLLYDDPRDPMPPPTVRFDALGLNRDGIPIRALAMDSQYLCNPGLAVFGVKDHTHHRRRIANVVYVDGHVKTGDNRDDRYTVDATQAIHQSFEKMLRAFENADQKP